MPLYTLLSRPLHSDYTYIRRSHRTRGSHGAQGETRTRTSLRTTDFKSVASTNSATRAGNLACYMEARDGIEKHPTGPNLRHSQACRDKLPQQLPQRAFGRRHANGGRIMGHVSVYVNHFHWDNLRHTTVNYTKLGTIAPLHIKSGSGGAITRKRAFICRTVPSGSLALAR